MDGLHEASVLQKTDLVHGAELGLVLGALLGAAAGVLFAQLVQTGTAWQLVTVVGAAALGSLFGAWVASMAGSAVPNSRLRRFESRIQNGMILLMIDVPQQRVGDVKTLFGKNHSEALEQDMEPNLRTFP